MLWHILHTLTSNKQQQKNKMPTACTFICMLMLTFMRLTVSRSRRFVLILWAVSESKDKWMIRIISFIYKYIWYRECFMWFVLLLRWLCAYEYACVSMWSKWHIVWCDFISENVNPTQWFTLHMPYCSCRANVINAFLSIIAYVFIILLLCTHALYLYHFNLHK